MAVRIFKISGEKLDQILDRQRIAIKQEFFIDAIVSWHPDIFDRKAALEIITGRSAVYRKKSLGSTNPDLVRIAIKKEELYLRHFRYK